MNKTLMLSIATATLLSSTNLCALTLEEKFEALQAQMIEMKKELDALKQKESKSTIDEDTKKDIVNIKRSISKLNKSTSGNHLKFGVDYRFALDNISYKMADGEKKGNDALLSNRLFVNMDWLATDNLSFSGQLAYNKAFGARSGSNTGNAYESFDWIANENAYDNLVRIRSAYFLYRNDTFLGNEIPWTFSVGRRPSTNGHLINMRDDDKAASPMAHTVNVEFDGLSSKFSLNKLTGVDGMYLKFCAGRGMSNAQPKFSDASYADNEDTNPSIDLAGLIFVPYNNGQYAVSTQYYYANNLIDMADMNDQSKGFDTVGGLHSFTANLTINGIGDEINDYLDDSTLFISGAVSRTNPKDNKRMLYSQYNTDMTQTDTGKSKTGYSIWAGIQMPSLFTEEGRWGLEYNYGSKYWKSITYGEDTNIGSKIATRGSAYEAYFTEYLIEDILSMQLRYTYIDYKYTGSNGFFGGTSGAAMSMSDANLFGMGNRVVDKAQDIRFYLRYKY